MILAFLFFMYAALAASFAFALLRMLPAGSVPALRLLRGAEQGAVGMVIGMILLSVWHTARELAFTFETGLLEMLQLVLYSTSQGNGVLGALLFGALWYGTDALAPEKAKRLLFFIAASGLVISAAASMHAATLTFAAFLAQAVHLFAISAWLGVLLLVGWLSQEGAGEAWSRFYRWYSPAAAGCVAAVMGSGIALMYAMSDSWVNAWVLDYGQMLLVKHLLIIPLLVFASINGLLIAPKAKRAKGVDPRGWMRAESVLSLSIFAVTAALSRTQPPHTLSETLTYTPPSRWFLPWYDGSVTPEIKLALHADPMSLLFGVLAVMFLVVMYAVYARRFHPSLAIFASLCFAALGYTALMLAVE